MRLTILKLDAMTAGQINDLYEQIVGYRPQVDDPTMTDDELRALVKDYITSSNRPSDEPTELSD
jgi:hypothetical protein